MSESTERKQLHACDAFCVCPIHLTPLLYSPHHGTHACQDPDCIHAHGIIHTIPLGRLLPRIQMGREMYEASPDGQAHQQRVRERVDALPDFTIDFEGAPGE